MKPEFREPVHDAQAVFRAILRAFAYPAGPVDCPVLPEPPHAALSPALAAACLTLMDQDTPLWLSPSLRQDDVVSWLAFHRGVRVTDDPMKAQFALAAGQDELPALDAFSQGDPRYPDRSATLLIGGADFSAYARHLTARGPGIEGEKTFCCSLSDALLEQIDENWHGFQLGVDILLSDGKRFAGLPRTTRLVPAREEN